MGKWHWSRSVSSYFLPWLPCCISVLFLCHSTAVTWCPSQCVNMNDYHYRKVATRCFCGPQLLLLSQGLPLQDPHTENVVTKSVFCWLVLWETFHWLHINSVIDPLVQKGAQMNPFSKWLSYTKYHNMTGDSVNRIWVTTEQFSMEWDTLYKLDFILQRTFNTW